jgi:cob(I)alamin adenosyltransferase
MKIYTKVGDGGNTYLFGGRRVRKNDRRVAAYGDVDELNSLLGWAASQPLAPRFRLILEAFQRDLFVLGADLATPRGVKTPVPRITPEHAFRLEQKIDALSGLVPPLRRFILPGGTPAGAALHWARAVARRAERSLVALLTQDASLLAAQIYLNRLSDCLFVLARAINHHAKRKEKEWVPSTKAQESGVRKNR